MRKKYSLDYNIVRDIDRLAAVENILDTLDTKPSNSDLEQMASYILYGKDENGKNSVQRKEVQDPGRRYNSFKKESEKEMSLDEIMEQPVTPPAMKSLDERYVYLKKKPSIARPKYAKDGTLIDIGDGDVPGMAELWESIDRMQHLVDANEGKTEFLPDEPVIDSNYRLYQLKHWLIDLRRHQYYLKDAYKPTLHFVNIATSSPQMYNWDSDSGYWVRESEWEGSLEDQKLELDADGNLYVWKCVRHHTFDWENPAHIKALIPLYGDIWMQCWDKCDSWARTLIFDFDRYVDMAKLTSLRQYILTLRIDKLTIKQIQEKLRTEKGVDYNDNHINSILTKEIPLAVAKAARAHRLVIETPESEKKTCNYCGKAFPRDILFFGHNAGRRDKWNSTCKECEKIKARLKNGGKVSDKRSKDEEKNLSAVQD